MQATEIEVKPIYLTEEAVDKIWEIDQMAGLKEGERSKLISEVLKPFAEKQYPAAPLE